MKLLSNFLDIKIIINSGNCTEPYVKKMNYEHLTNKEACDYIEEIIDSVIIPVEFITEFAACYSLKWPIAWLKCLVNSSHLSS